MKESFLILALFAASAHAQTGSIGTCAPSDLKGAGTAVIIDFNQVGAAAGWWCPGATRPKLYAVRWAGMTQPLHESLRALSKPGDAPSADVGSAIAALANANTNTPIAKLRDVWGPMEARLMAARPVIAWEVAPAPLNANPPGTRPAYSWVGGVRGSVSNGRAAQGSPCNPAIGAEPYFGVNGRPDQVAVCVRQ